MAPKTTRSTKPRTTRSAKSTPTPMPSRPAKPVIGAGTWITVLVLAGLIGFAVWLNKRPATPDANGTPTSSVSYVFTDQDGRPTSIEVKPAEGNSVRVARNSANAWALELPEAAAADQGSVEAAATSVTTLRILNSQVNGAPDIFGLDKPAYTITVRFTGGSVHVLEVGDKTPTNNGYYVRLDNQKMMIVSLDGIDSLLTLVQSPPYLSTPTPTALPPTETPNPTSTNRPELTVTPTP